MYINTNACAGPRGLAGYVAAFRTYVNKENTVAVEEFGETGRQRGEGT